MNIKKLSSKYNVSESYLEIITDRNILELVINDIKSDKGNVHIEVLQFIRNTNYFPFLEEKLDDSRKILSGTNDYEKRRVLTHEIQKIEEEVKQYKLGILMTSYILLELEEAHHLEKTKELFFQGKIKQAIQTIDSASIEKTKNYLLSALETKNNLQKVYLQLVDNAFEFLIKGQLTILNLEITSFEDRFKKALYFFDKGVISVERSRQLEKEALYKIKYGSFLKDHNHYSKAYTLLKRGLYINRRLATNSPEIFLPNISMILSYQANILMEQNKIHGAERKHIEALKINRTLSKSSPKIYLPNIARILNNLGTLHLKNNDFDKAENTYTESLNIYKQLVKSNSNYMSDVASVLNGLAIISRYKEDIEGAEKYYLESLEIGKSLAKENPQLYLFNVAEVLNNLAILQFDKNDRKKSKKFFTEALHIFKKLAKDHPKHYLPNVGGTLNNLAIIYRDENKLEKAEKLFLESIEIFRKFVKLNPEVYIPYLAGNQINMARFYQNHIINKELSLSLIDEATTILFPFRHIPFFRTYFNQACHILNKWGIDYISYFAEKDFT